MSYQGTEWARTIAGTCGEKNVLAQLGHRLDQRTNIAHVSESDLARDTGLCERQVRRILRRLEGRGVLNQSGGRGPGNFAKYSFIGFERRKADILSLESGHPRPSNRTFTTPKADIGDTRTNRVRAREEKSKLKKPSSRGETDKTAPPQCSQSDFDERDLRKMAEARREAEKRPDSVGGLADDEYFLWICTRAGLTVQRGLAIQESQRQALAALKPKTPVQRGPCEVCNDTGLVGEKFCPTQCQRALELWIARERAKELRTKKEPQRVTA